MNMNGDWKNEYVKRLVRCVLFYNYIMKMLEGQVTI